jgi:hypothetical protein
MVNSFKFAVIQASPDRARGELVNIGVLCEGLESLIIQAPELRKLKLLTGHDWGEVLDRYSSFLQSVYKAGDPGWIKLAQMSDVFKVEKFGEIRCESKNVQQHVEEILKTFVCRPTLSRKEKRARINTEMAKIFKAGGLLGDPDQGIDSGRVVQKFTVSEAKGAVVDFAYRTNRLKVVSTLDLRSTKIAAHARACERGSSLYFARQAYGSELQAFAVFAAPPSNIEEFQSEIEVLKDFSGGNAFNWINPEEQRAFRSLFY